ncbi:anthranilate synthase component I [Candidatus Portiera aleyrodidarum]|uniref:Anthranilate synthase component 1 n=2 Tax=Candidatus Portiera aleyrodidarum TaxID=91844 RepID=A0AAU8RPY6_9GAMM|nr:anthranilate synthase component I [Candidatus Portiera aleyrodidarum]AFS18950.1 Anthranilate synthase component 1 [Candidatus Portiera aleyrodidarum BT-QVLC]AFT80604.1 Anthranilate synthase aminase component [Candidatus Portiera aleyrodidarum BT-QVLC]AJF24171.1 anthranilate synthase component I [Candidatus Portiera aleyrodidarum MED (Bemisia tabaci)]AUI73109.1 anthranilate synthase [Candidatus Portiera aleyrodidarum]
MKRILIYKEIISDLDTPLSLYMKVANYHWTFLLESIEGKKQWCRYSIIGLRCHQRIEIYNNKINLFKDKIKIEKTKKIDTLVWLSNYIKTIKKTILKKNKSKTILDGGLVGYLGYDIIRLIEPTIKTYKQYNPINTPDIFLLRANELLIIDKYSGRLTILVNVNIYDLKKGLERIKIILKKLSLCANFNKTELVTHSFQTHIKHKYTLKPIFSSFNKFTFQNYIINLQKYINSGDVMQCVPSQRIIIPFYSQPFNLFRALRVLNPSPYMLFFNFNDHYVVGSSPEILVRVDNKTITLRPIAGTIQKRSGIHNEILKDYKEVSEHIMLIDLGRNDVGKVSSTVRVQNQFLIERYSHVRHIVSTLIGILKHKIDLIDIVRATFPAGTIAGAPKIRALEIINTLEPIRRGIYSGAIGFLSWNGNMNIAIAIRTAIVKNYKLHIQAGVGIIEESQYKKEWNEILNKSSVILKAALIAIVEEKGDKVENINYR